MEIDKWTFGANPWWNDCIPETPVLVQLASSSLSPKHTNRQTDSQGRQADTQEGRSRQADR